MFHIDARKCSLWALLFVAFLLTCRTMLAAGIVLPNAYANMPGCTFYVSNSGSNNGSGGTTLATAWRTLSFASSQVQSYVPLHPGVAIGVCVQAGDYYADDYDPNSTTIHPETSQPNSANITAAVLPVSIKATAAAPVWFIGVAGPNYPVIHQSGYNGIQFNSGAAYVTIYHLTVMGQAQNPSAPTTTLKGRILGTNPAWPFYDGNCIGTFGNYPTGTNPPTNPTYAAITASIATHITILSSQAIQCGGGGIATKLSDYWTIQGNQVVQNSNWSIYLTSGISMLNDVDSDGSSPAYKNYIVNNKVTGNIELLTHGATDGEGIIIDRNMNRNAPDFATLGILNQSSQSISPLPYPNNTLIANNVIWNNGHAGIETFYTRFVDIFNNSTYRNATNLSGNGELFLNYSSQIASANNILYSATGCQPIVGNNYTAKGSIYNGVNTGGNNTFFLQSGNLSLSPVYTSYGYDITTDPGYKNPMPATWSAIDLTTLVGSTASTNSCVSGGVLCSSPTQDINSAARSTTPHPPDGAYATTHN